MRQMGWILATVAFLAVPASVGAQDTDAQAYPLEVRVWLDRGMEPVLRRGDRVRIYYRTSEDAYVAIFHIDTDGSIRLLFPRSPEGAHYAAAGRDYQLLFPQSSYWHVDEYEGKGYFFALASPTPFDFSGLRYMAHEKAWDLRPVGRTVYQDPYLAMDDYVAAVLPRWETTPYALDFISYDVDQAHEYPRFLCYDCHGFRSYATWNPYTYACTSFRVVVWDDPYFYPAYRYGPTRVVFATPPRGQARFEFKERAPGEAWSPLQRTRQPAQRRSVEYMEPSVADPDRPEIVPPRRRTVPDGVQSRPTAAQDRPSPAAGEPAQRRSTTVAPLAAPRRPTEPAPDTRPGAEPRDTRAVTPPSSPSTERPTLQRRPGTEAPTRPSTGSPAPTGTRPTRVVVPGSRPDAGRPSAQPSTPSRGGVRVVRPPAAGRPTPQPRPSVRPGSSAPSARPAPRPSARPTPRPAPSRPTVRPKRPPPKKPGG